MLETRQSSMFAACVAVGLALLASRYRKNVFRSVNRFCQVLTVSAVVRKGDGADKAKGDRLQDEKAAAARKSRKQQFAAPSNVILADTPELCDYAVQRIRCNLSEKVLGFDCEWVNEGPVSLLQLATLNGVCALFRLNKIGHVPPGLRELLSNPELLKVGVGPDGDSRKIVKDYSCQVLGTVDLRNLASRLGLPSPRSLSALCVQYLDVELDKTSELRCSDWTADCLDDEQIAYASADAYVSVLIYHQILEKARQKRTLWASLMSYVKKYMYCISTKNIVVEFFDLPQGVIDSRFKVLNDRSPIIKRTHSVNDKNGQLISVDKVSSTEGQKNSIPARNKPLYHNCYLQAPDGEILCTCDKKKAEWYVSKHLGEIVEEDPFTVKLKFEPSGRALGEVGKYYTQVKLNQCVVCGASEKFIRKNVVPREYRKYFPLVMKSHQSHDVLLLCPVCHQESNAHDLQLRRELAKTCDAPLTNPLTCARDEMPLNWKKLQTAVRVLRDPRTPIPLERRRELEDVIVKYSGYPAVTPEMLDYLYVQLKKMSPYKSNLTDRTKRLTPQNQPKAPPHGLKVVEYFKNRVGGLVELEKIWREHFLNTMKPKHLPELWSVSHNQERLNIRHTQNRIEPEDAKLAGIKC